MTPEELIQTTDWDKYYREGASAFGENAIHYRYVIDDLTKSNPRLLTPHDPKSFLLGGFFPYNGTPENFVKFCQAIHKNSDDKHIFLDMNEEPLRAIKRRYPKYRVQAALEHIPFATSSIDLIFLDYTSDFMSDKQVHSFAKDVADCLSEDGLVVIAKNFPQDLAYTQDEHSFVALYPRPIQETLSLLTDLKPVYFYPKFHGTVFALSRKDSPYPQREPTPLVLSEQYDPQF